MARKCHKLNSLCCPDLSLFTVPVITSKIISSFVPSIRFLSLRLARDVACSLFLDIIHSDSCSYWLVSRSYISETLHQHAQGARYIQASSACSYTMPAVSFSSKQVALVVCITKQTIGHTCEGLKCEGGGSRETSPPCLRSSTSRNGGLYTGYGNGEIGRWLCPAARYV